MKNGSDSKKNLTNSIAKEFICVSDVSFQRYNNVMAKMSIPTICGDKGFCQDAPFLPLDTRLLSASQWINRSKLRGEIIRISDSN